MKAEGGSRENTEREEGSTPSAPTLRAEIREADETNDGIKVLAAAHPALNRASEGSSPSGPTEES